MPICIQKRVCLMGMNWGWEGSSISNSLTLTCLAAHFSRNKKKKKKVVCSRGGMDINLTFYTGWNLKLCWSDVHDSHCRWLLIRFAVCRVPHATHTDDITDILKTNYRVISSAMVWSWSSEATLKWNEMMSIIAGQLHSFCHHLIEPNILSNLIESELLLKNGYFLLLLLTFQHSGIIFKLHEMWMNVFSLFRLWEVITYY